MLGSYFDVAIAKKSWNSLLKYSTLATICQWNYLVAKVDKYNCKLHWLFGRETFFSVKVGVHHQNHGGAQIKCRYLKCLKVVWQKLLVLLWDLSSKGHQLDKQQSVWPNWAFWKVSAIVINILGYFWKRHFQSKKLYAHFWATLGKLRYF